MITVKPGDPPLRTFTIGTSCEDGPITSDDMNTEMGRHLEARVVAWRAEHQMATIHFITGGLQDSVGQWTLWYTEPSKS